MKINGILAVLHGQNGIYRSVNPKKIGGNFYIYSLDFRISIDYFNEMVFII